MEKERKHYPDIAPTGPTHVRALKFGDLMFISGTTALGTPAQGAPLVEQARAALGKIQRIVEREGRTMSDIVKLTTYVTDIQEYRDNEKEIDAVWTEVFNGDYSPNTLVEVSSLAHDDLFIEVEAVVGF